MKGVYVHNILMWANVNLFFRLTESSAGVAEQLASTQRMAEDLVLAQSAALKSQESILRNGEELKSTLQDSTQGDGQYIKKKDMCLFKYDIWYRITDSEF